MTSTSPFCLQENFEKFVEEIRSRIVEDENRPDVNLEELNRSPPVPLRCGCV